MATTDLLLKSNNELRIVLKEKVKKDSIRGDQVLLSSIEGVFK
jgi:hypothetical protein